MATREQLIEDFADHKYATGEKFERLINSMKVVQEPVETPAASGTSLSFIDSIEQDKDGKITATKKTLDLANAHELNPFKGWYKTGDTLPTTGFDGAYLYFKDTAQTPAVTTIYRWNGTTYADTGTVVDESNVQTFGSGQQVNAVKIKDENGDEVTGPVDVLSAEAGAELAAKTNEVNVGSAASLAAAIALVPHGMRKAGLTVTYYDTEALIWVAKQYVGTALSGWSTESNWTDAKSVDTDNDGMGDLDIADEDNNVIVRFANGHIKTKYFDSSNIAEQQVAVSDNSGNTDLDIADEDNNVLLSLSNGGIKTRNFDSETCNEELSKLKEDAADIEGRVSHVEQGGMDAESIIQTALTRAAALFAPIGEADVAYTPKRSFKILFIGNSVTQDHVGYVPWLLRNLYPNDIDFTIGNFYYAGRTLREYVEEFIIDTNPQTGLYSHATNTHVWTQQSGKTLLYAITQENWDYISIQAYTPRNTVSDEAAAAVEFVSWLRTKCPSPFELCYLMHQSFSSSSSVQQEVRDVAEAIIKQNPVTVLFSPYFCMKEAQKYWQVDGFLSPTGDGTHLKEGVPVMITGMHLMQVLCTKLGLTNKVLKNGLMMTTAIWNTLNVPGPNPPASPAPDDSTATDLNYQKAQMCSIQGTKEAQAFYDNAIKYQLETLLS